MDFKKNSHVIASTLGCAAITLPLLLAACGDDSSSNSANKVPEPAEGTAEDYTFTLEELEEMGVPIFESADKLGDCGSENEFETVYVKADSSFFMCDEGRWSNDFSTAMQTVDSVDDLEQCTDELEGEMVRVKTTNVDGDTVHIYYSCEDGKWESDIGGSSEAIDPATVVKGEVTDERDGKTYKTVQIGKQTWMAENLKFKYHIGGKPYGVFCYDDNISNCDKYGMLYTWAAAMDSAGVFSEAGKGCGNGVGPGNACKDKLSAKKRGICPEGWHVPNADEWLRLVSRTEPFLSLLSKSEWPKLKATDVYGFSVLPTGYKFEKGYNLKDSWTNFWASTRFDKFFAKTMKFPVYGNPLISFKKTAGIPLRCIKD